jgi:hypothetical protein
MTTDPKFGGLALQLQPARTIAGNHQASFGELLQDRGKGRHSNVEALFIGKAPKAQQTWQIKRKR